MAAPQDAASFVGGIAAGMASTFAARFPHVPFSPRWKLRVDYFFIAAPFSGRNLELFRRTWNNSVTSAEALKKAKDALRQAAGSIQVASKSKQAWR